MLMSLAAAGASAFAASCNIPVAPLGRRFAEMRDWPEAGVEVLDAHPGMAIELPAAAAPVGDRRVALIPFGNFPVSLLQLLQFYYRDRFGLALEIRDRLPLSTNEGDAQRGQFAVPRLYYIMQQTYPAEWANPKQLLFGFTSYDLYQPLKRDWSFVFTWRDANAAVLSGARMDETVLGRASNPELLETRVRKMTTKNLALMLYGLETSSDPKSAVYGDVGGIEELDAMTERF